MVRRLKSMAFILGFSVAISSCNWMSEIISKERLSSSSPAPGDSIPDVLGTKMISNISFLGTSVSAAQISTDGNKIVSFLHEPTASNEYRIFMYDGLGENPISFTLPVFPDSTSTSTFAFTPDSQRFIFTYSGALYSVRTDGSQFARLTIPLVSGGSIASFKITPDSSRIIYAASAENSGVIELYSSLLDGTGQVKLSTTAVATGGILNQPTEYLISADSSRVVYRNRYNSASSYEIYSVEPNGNNHLKLNSTLPVGGKVNQFKVSPNSQYVIYQADVDTLNKLELYITSISAATTLKLNGAFIANGDILSFDFYPDSSKVIYGADALLDEVYNLYIVNIDGSNLLMLNVPSAGTQDAQFVKIDTNNSRIYYAHDTSANNVFSLYGIDPDGNNRTQVVANFGTYNVVYNLMPGGYQDRLEFTTAGGPIIVIAGDYYVYRVNTDGSGSTLLSPAVAGYLPGAIWMTPDRQGLYYSLRTNPGGVWSKLYYSNVDGTQNTMVFSESPSSISSFSQSTVDDRVLITTGSRVVRSDRLGVTQKTLLGTMPGYTLWFQGLVQMTPNNQKIIFRNEIPAGGSFALYSANPDGTNVVQLTPGAGEIVGAPYVAPDNLTVNFNVGNDVYRVNTDGTGYAKISGAVPINWFFGLRYSPVGDYTVYEARQDVMFTNELYACKNDGTGRVKLNGVLFSNGDVRWWDFSPTAAKLVYIAQQSAANVSDLYTVNLDGTNNTKIDPALPVGGQVETLNGNDPVEVSRDGNKIVYIAEQNTAGVFEIFSVNWDGSSHTRLNAPLTANGDVYGLRVSPDSQTVVYQADQDTDGTIELYRVDINGTGRLKISGTMVSGGGVVPGAYGTQNMEMTSDSKFVVFYADKDIDGVIELYAAKLDGSAVYKLNQPLVAGGSIKSFKLTSDGSTVIYSADAEVKGRNELYTVRIDGSNRKKINRSLATSDRIEQYDVKNNHIVFRVRRNGIYELYRSNKDATTIERLHSELTGLQSVGQNIDFSPDNSVLMFSINNEDYAKSTLYFLNWPQ